MKTLEEIKKELLKAWDKYEKEDYDYLNKKYDSTYFREIMEIILEE